MNNGRPLRFLAVSLGGWTALRVVALWPPPTTIAFDSPAAAAATPHRISVERTSGTERQALWPLHKMPSRAVLLAGHDRTDPVAFLPAQAMSRVPPATIRTTTPTLPLPYAIPSLARPPSRWAASAWLIARGGGSARLLGGQLGASQAGARITYLLDSRRRIALAARVATPLSGRGREAALGIDWQPTRLPFHLIAEQRVGFDGGRGGPAIVAVGGFGPVEIAPHLHAEGYGQAGAIARDGGEAFVDGSARVAYGFAETGRVRFDLGAGGWGGAQRGAARLDIGPSLGIAAPLGGKTIRLTLGLRYYGANAPSVTQGAIVRPDACHRLRHDTLSKGLLACL